MDSHIELSSERLMQIILTFEIYRDRAIKSAQEILITTTQNKLNHKLWRRLLKKKLTREQTIEYLHHNNGTPFGSRLDWIVERWDNPTTTADKLRLVCQVSDTVMVSSSDLNAVFYEDRIEQNHPYRFAA